MTDRAVFEKYLELTEVEREAAERQNRAPKPIYMHIEEWKMFLSGAHSMQLIELDTLKPLVMNGVPIGYYE